MLQGTADIDASFYGEGAPDEILEQEVHFMKVAKGDVSVDTMHKDMLISNIDRSSLRSLYLSIHHVFGPRIIA